jgi:YidC/Oxa1 family membrane protein insertase
MSDAWYYADGEKPVGPLAFADLTAILSRVSNAEDVLVWRAGFEQWQRAVSVAELAAFVIKPPKPPHLPPPLPSLSSTLPSGPSIVSATEKDHKNPPSVYRAGLDKRSRNIIVAIVLGLMVVIGWQYFVGYPQMERQRQEAALKQQEQTKQPEQSHLQAVMLTREAVIAASPRIAIETPKLHGSVNLKGGRIDDLSLMQYRETVDPNSPVIVLLSPSVAPDAYFADFGWVPASGTTAAMPGPDTMWTQQGSGALGVNHPVTLTYDNGAGLVFARTIAVDDHYLFTIKDAVTNKSVSAVTLFPYALISRRGTPNTLGYYILHEGLIGVMGNDGLQEETYKKIEDKKSESWDVTDAWLGFTDRYWATAMLPHTNAKVHARFTAREAGGQKTYQTDYLLEPVTVAPGATGSADARLFAGAKEVSVVGINFLGGIDGGYNTALGLNHFDLLIEWGFISYFIAKPMFLMIDYFYRLVGNLGVAILIFATIIKIIFVPFANRSYRSMIKIQRLQPQIAALRERFPEQEQAYKEILELYKHENVTAPSGCLPIVIQSLLCFSLYKVLFVSIEMRHAPFYGWIQDLSAPDPTNVFNLFGLVPFDPATVPLLGSFLHVGALPIILGLTVWQLQRNISPIRLGSVQREAYAVLPLLVIYFSGRMMVGMLLYFLWFTILSIIHQQLLMKKEKVVVGEISEYSAEVLPMGKMQPIVFLTMLAPSLQNVLMVLVFWRRSKRPKITPADPTK